MSAGTFSAIGDVSASVAIDQDDGLSITLTNTGGNLWTVVLEESIGNASWRQMATYSSDQSAIVVTPRLGRMMIVRLRAATILTGDTIAYTVTRVSNQDGVTLTLADGVLTAPALALVAVDPVALYVATASITNAQFLTLPTTGVTTVPSPGAGKVIIPVVAIVEFNLTTGYTVDAGSSLNFKQGGSGISGIIKAVRYTSSGHRYRRVALDAQYVLAGDDANFAYQAGDGGFPTQAIDDSIIMIDDWVGVNDYTGGNVANTITVRTWYHILDLS